jgi:L-seryl-tRNA(Ser) seleniumtransferase
LSNFDTQPFERVNLDKDWIEIIQRLPDTSWTNNKILVQKMHRHNFDHAYEIAGAKLVNVGNENGCSLDDIKKNIDDKVAAIAYTARVDNTPEKAGKNVSLKNVVKLAHTHEIPVIVDAASELPPRSNLKKFIEEGADLVIISGGKHLGGPNDTGILCGKYDLIKLAKLQCAPYRGIGRGMKVDRTQIVGLITALNIYLERDEKEIFERDKEMVQYMTRSLENTKKVLNVESIIQEARNRLFTIITMEPKVAEELVYKLRLNDPSIWVELLNEGKIEVDPSNLKKGEEVIVIQKIKEILQKI